MLTPEFLESNVTIMEVLHDFHRASVNSFMDRLTTTCPKCGSIMHVFDSYVLCESKECDFRTGTSFDLLAIIEGSYAAAISAAIQAYPSRFNHLKHSDVDFAASLFNQRRELLRFIMEVGSGQSALTDINVLQARNWLRHIGVDVQAQPYSALVMSRAQFGQFLILLDQISGDRPVPRIPLGKSQPAIVLPLFASPCVVAGAVMFPLRQSGDMRIFHTGKYRFGFTGLLDMHPDCTQRHVFANVLTALQYNTEAAKTFRDHFGTSVAYDPRAGLRIWQPDNAVYEFRNETPANMSAIAELAGSTTLSVQRGQLELPMTWSDFCLQHVLDMIYAAQGITQEVRLVLSALKYDEPKFQRLIDELQQHGQLDWAAHVAEVRQTQMIHQAGKVMFYRSATGYYAIRADGARADISNFILTFHSNVVFADSASTCHVGVMTFRGHEYPITMTSEQFNAAGTVEETARLAEFTKASINPGGDLPTIHERQLVRDLLQYFRQVTSCLPRSEGIDGLGWTRRRSAFLTPWGKISETEWNPAVRVPNPIYDMWGSYDLTQHPVTAPLTADIPVPIADLISQIIGMIGRSHADFFVKPIAVLYTPEANRILRSLFNALGQVEPYSFSVRDGSNLEVRGLRGFPMLITGATKGQVERSKQPLFALGDTGISIFTNPTDEELKTACRMLPWIVQKVVQWILATKGEQVKVFNSVNIAAALVREGAGIIRAACDLEWPESQPIYATIERMLNQIHFNACQQLLSHHLGDQTITLDMSRIVDVDQTDLHLELSREARTVRFEDKRLIVDALSFLRLLENFYGQIPPMARTGLPPAATG